MSLSYFLILGACMSELRNTVTWTSPVSFLWYRKKWYPMLLQLQSSTGIWPFHTGPGTLIKPLPESAKQHGLINEHRMVQSFLHTKFPPVNRISWLSKNGLLYKGSLEKNANIVRIRRLEELLQSTRVNAQWIHTPVTDSMILSKNNPQTWKILFDLFTVVFCSCVYLTGKKVI